MPDYDSVDLSHGSIDDLLARTRQTLDLMRSGRPAADDPATESEAVGEAADGRVRATVRNGSLTSVYLDPRLMRLGSEELCEHFVAAVNAAFAQARTLGSQAAPTTVDPAALSEQLQGIQEASARQMAAFGAAMNDALARMRQARA